MLCDAIRGYPLRQSFDMATSLIIGGSGFLGRHVASYLMARGQHVIAADVVPLPHRARSSEFRLIDLNDAADTEVDFLVRDADVVYHFAWSSIPATAESDPARDLRDNVGATLRVLEAIRRRGSGTVVFPSSGGTVYGRLSQVPAPEDHPLNPISAYAAAKVSAEKYLGVFRYIHGVDARIARLANPYGAGQSRLRPQGSVARFVHLALEGQPIEIWGDGRVVRDFVHVADAISGLVSLGEASLAETFDVPTVNIGTGRGVSLNEIVETIEAQLGRQLEVVRQPPRAFDVPVNVLDIGRARDILGWVPLLSFEEGVGRMIEDLRLDPDRILSTLHPPAIPI